jgi:hypothetical protein
MILCASSLHATDKPTISCLPLSRKLETWQLIKPPSEAFQEFKIQFLTSRQRFSSFFVVIIFVVDFVIPLSLKPYQSYRYGEGAGERQSRGMSSEMRPP